MRHPTPVRALVLLCVALASGTARADMRVESPDPIDPFTGIMDRSLLQPSGLERIEGVQNMSVAVLLTENTKAQMNWSAERTKGLKGFGRFGASFGGGTLMSDLDRGHEHAYDPKRVSDALMAPLSNKARSVRVVNSVDEFRNGDDDLLVLLNVNFLNDYTATPFATGLLCKVGMTVDAFIIDREGKLTTVSASKQRKSSEWGYLTDVEQIRADVLQMYSLAMDRTLGPDRPAPIEVAPSTAPAPSALDRLATIDQALQRGLITPEEHAQKRAEILSSM